MGFNRLAPEIILPKNYRSCLSRFLRKRFYSFKGSRFVVDYLHFDKEGEWQYYIKLIQGAQSINTEIFKTYVAGVSESSKIITLDGATIEPCKDVVQNLDGSYNFVIGQKMGKARFILGAGFEPLRALAATAFHKLIQG